MSLDTLDRTGLIQPGSLIRWIYRLKLPGERGNDRTALNTARFAIEAKFPESGFAITDWTDPGALDPPRGQALHPIHQPGRARRAPARRHRRRQRHRQLHGEEAAGDRHLQDAWAPRAASCLPSISSRRSCSPVSASFSGSCSARSPPLCSRRSMATPCPLRLPSSRIPLSLLTAAGAGLLTMLLFVLLPLGRASVVPPAVLMRSHLTDEQERPPLALHRRRGGSGARAVRLWPSRPRRSRRSPPRSPPASSPDFSCCWASAGCCRSSRPGSGAPSHRPGRSRWPASPDLAPSPARSPSRLGSGSASSSPSR